MKNRNFEAAVLNYEMVHWASKELFIAHEANTITYRKNGNEEKIEMPVDELGWRKLLIFFRKVRRLLRTDKVMLTPTDSGFVLVRFGRVYVYDSSTHEWNKSTIVLNCRNPMYNGLLNLEGVLYLGEYGNPSGIGKRILRSIDSGYNWACVYQFTPDEIRHIHCLAWDEYEKKIWIFTGDSDHECKVLKADVDFRCVELVGGGSQIWRSCHALFTKDKVRWMMDSPLEKVKLIEYDRKTQKISTGQSFPGPVWFAKQYKNQAFAATAQELGPSHEDKKLHLYQSTDLEIWKEIAVLEHDKWPKRYFRFGTITLSHGDIPYISCEGVKGLDGKSIKL